MYKKILSFIVGIILGFCIVQFANAQSSCSAAQVTLNNGVAVIPELVEAPTCVHDNNASYGISYTNSGNVKHKFDLYRPSVNPAPVVVWIHGGGWQTGTRNNIQQVRRLVCAGYAVASISYRLSDEAVFPAQIHDVKAAIRYIRANASILNVQGNKIVTFGSSAGGHLAALAATSRGVPELEDLSMGNSTTPSGVQAAIVWYGPSDFSQMDNQIVNQGCPLNKATHNLSSSAESKVLGCTGGLTDPLCFDKIDSANPAAYVSSSTPPVMILHGDQDCTVPVGQSEILRDSIQAVNKCVIYRPVQGANHGNTTTTFPWTSDSVQKTSVDFLKKFIRP